MNACCYSVLSDGSMDSAIIEQELVYILYLSNVGVPVVKYLSIESAENGDPAGLKDCITNAFQRFGIMKLSQWLLGFNVVGVSVDIDIQKGFELPTKFKKWGELDRISILKGSCWERGGDLFQGGCSFT